MVSLERAKELESLVKELEEQLGSQEESAGSAISQWQESYVELEKQNKELLEALEARTTVERSMSADQENLSAFESLQADLQQTKMALAAAQAKLEDDDSVVVKWEGKFSYGSFEGCRTAR